MRTGCAGRRPYLVIVENKAKRSRDRPERIEGSCGVSRPAESLAPRSNSAAEGAVGLQFGFFSSAAVPGSWVSSGRTTSCPWSGRAGASALSEGIVRDSDQNDRVHVLSSFSPRRSGWKGVDPLGFSAASTSDERGQINETPGGLAVGTN